MLLKLYLVYSTIHEIDSYDEGRTYCELLYRQVSLPCIKRQVTSHLVLQFILTESIVLSTCNYFLFKEICQNHDLPEQGAYT